MGRRRRAKGRRRAHSVSSHGSSEDDILKKRLSHGVVDQR